MENKDAGKALPLKQTLQSSVAIRKIPADTDGKLLFAGQSAAAKWAAAQALGKDLGKAVYRIDLAGVVGKYINETEKNLQAIFDQNAGKDTILFFDEADALFGKTTPVKDAPGQFSNEAATRLLQLVAQYSGMVILSCSQKMYEAPAAVRFFTQVVSFPTRK